MDPGQGHRKGLKASLLPITALAVAACGGGSEAPASSPAPSPSPPSAAGCAPVAGTPPLGSLLVAGGLASPVDLQAPPGDRTRLFVLEQAGRIRIVRDGSLRPAPFLDIASEVRVGEEQGLLGLAFHPRYAENGRFFLNYTDRAGDTHVAEFRASSDPDIADRASERTLLFIDQPFSNHNGGGMAFGADGMLYIGVGDGGSAGDPRGNGQSLATHLGKLLRIDVDRGSPYAVPPDNPFVSTPGARAEIWAFGLRNPWRFAFDRSTGDLLTGDVGQNAVEEVDLGLASRHGGENYGWNVTEGSRCFQPPAGCNTAGLTLPILEYTHAEGCAVMGGVVYRGCRMPGYHGTYFYGDYCTSFIRSFRVENGQAVDRRDWTSAVGRDVDRLTSFGVDADGEVYLVDQQGEIYKIVPAG